MATRSYQRGRKVQGRGEQQTRNEISIQAARIMAEEGVRDFQAAKRKAAQRLNLPDGKNLPSNQEVQAALQEHLRLFQPDLPQTLQHLRELALEAMQSLEPFAPRLVGPVLTGAVTKFSEIQLHITAAGPEEVGFFLEEQGITFEQSDKRLRFGGERFLTFPAFRFIAGETPIEVCVFTPILAREAPLSPVDGRPMQRANFKEVEALLRP